MAAERPGVCGGVNPKPGQRASLLDHDRVELVHEGLKRSRDPRHHRDQLLGHRHRACRHFSPHRKTWWGSYHGGNRSPRPRVEARRGFGVADTGGLSPGCHMPLLLLQDRGRPPSRDSPQAKHGSFGDVWKQRCLSLVAAGCPTATGWCCRRKAQTPNNERRLTLSSHVVAKTRTLRVSCTCVRGRGISVVGGAVLRNCGVLPTSFLSMPLRAKLTLFAIANQPCSERAKKFAQSRLLQTPSRFFQDPLPRSDTKMTGGVSKSLFFSAVLMHRNSANGQIPMRQPATTRRQSCSVSVICYLLLRSRH